MVEEKTSKTGFEKWQESIKRGTDNAKWDDWDCEIKKIVGEYNQHLADTPGYMQLDWKIIKAMLWIETGADSAQWKIKPMQIGVLGDPGLNSFLSEKEGGDLILPIDWKRRLTVSSAKTIPQHNIRAAVGYLLMRMARYEYKSVSEAESKIFEVTVKSGDNLSKIAKNHGSTIGELGKLNPMTAKFLKPGQVLKCRKASVRQVITGWRLFSTTLIAERYNGGGDPNYAKKLDFALSLIRKRKVSLCE